MRWRGCHYICAYYVEVIRVSCRQRLTTTRKCRSGHPDLFSKGARRWLHPNYNNSDLPEPDRVFRKCRVFRQQYLLQLGRPENPFAIVWRPSFRPNRPLYPSPPYSGGDRHRRTRLRLPGCPDRLRANHLRPRVSAVHRLATTWPGSVRTGPSHCDWGRAIAATRTLSAPSPSRSVG